MLPMGRADPCDGSRDHRSLSKWAGAANAAWHATAMDAVIITTCTHRMHNFGTCSTLATWSARDIRDREITGNASTYDRPGSESLSRCETGVDRPLNHRTGRLSPQCASGLLSLRR